jgi:hypothetical protein
MAAIKHGLKNLTAFLFRNKTQDKRTRKRTLFIVLGSCIPRVVIVSGYKRHEREKQHCRLLHIQEKITFSLLKKVKINNE